MLVECTKILNKIEKMKRNSRKKVNREKIKSICLSNNTSPKNKKCSHFNVQKSKEKLRFDLFFVQKCAHQNIDG
jgi:hypothetical protein